MLFEFNLWQNGKIKRKCLVTGEVDAENLILAIEKVGLTMTPGRRLEIEVKPIPRKKRGIERPMPSRISQDGID